MYAFLCALAAGLLTLSAFLFLPQEPWTITGILVGLVAFCAAYILVVRRFVSKVNPILQLAQAQAQSGNLIQAIKTAEEARVFGKWVPGLNGQVSGQIGMIHYADGNDREADQFLRDASLRDPMGFAMRAAIPYRNKDFKAAQETLENGVMHNKKSALLQNFLAYTLNQQGDREAAIAVLEGCVGRLKDSEATEENLERLRNKQRLNMGAFGDIWYSLRIESLPGMTVARPGFRQKPKRKGQRRKR